MIPRKRLNVFFAGILSLFTWISANAQEPQMADLFRKEGKIYVVIGVILIIFAGLVAFLVYLDRKLNKLEKK